MKAIIISGGEQIDISRLKLLAPKVDIIICADSGYDYARKINLIPDYIVGDFDSLSKKGVDMLDRVESKVVRYKAEKNATDHEIAVDKALELGCTDLTFFGMTGSRLDHSLGNILNLSMLCSKGYTCRSFSEGNDIYGLKGGSYHIKTDKYYVSILPISMKGIVISVNNSKYEVDRLHVEFGSTRAISNEPLFDEIQVSVHDGTGLLICSERK